MLKGAKSSPAWKKEVIEKLNQQINIAKNPELQFAQSSLINCDKLFDYCMKQKGIRGETMGDRLRNAGNYFSKDLYNQIWQAHKVRNQLAHEMNIQLKRSEVEYYLSIFNRGIRALAE